MFVFTQSDNIFTVGCFNEHNVWFPARDFNEQGEAEEYCSYLNGGDMPLSNRLTHATLICEPNSIPQITFDCKDRKMRDQLTRRALEGYSDDTKFYALTGEYGFCPKVERFEEYELRPGKRMFIGESTERNGDFEYTDKFIFYATEDDVETEYVKALHEACNRGDKIEPFSEDQPDIWWNTGETTFHGNGYSIVPRHEEISARRYI